MGFPGSRDVLTSIPQVLASMVASAVSPMSGHRAPGFQFVFMGAIPPHEPRRLGTPTNPQAGQVSKAIAAPWEGLPRVPNTLLPLLAASSLSPQL